MIPKYNPNVYTTDQTIYLSNKSVDRFLI